MLVLALLFIDLAESLFCAIGRCVKTIPHLNYPFIGFTHISKTAGTAIRRMRCPDVLDGGHWMRAATWQKMGLATLVVLREPVDRFVSAFAYAQIGSELHFGRDLDLPHMYRQDFLRYPTPGDFIDALAENDASRTGHAWRILKERHDGIQFAKQSWWTQGANTSLRMHVVCYSKHNLEHDINALLQSIGSNCTFSLRINKTCKVVSVRKEEGEDKWAVTMFPYSANKTLTTAQVAWLRQYYHRDMDLWKQHCSSHHRRRNSNLYGGLPPDQ